MSSTTSAAATGLPSITRRGLVAAAPAAIVAAAVPALAAGSAGLDVALLALREPYERTLAGIEAVSPAHSRAEDAYFTLRAAHPDRDERWLRKASGLVLAERAYYRAMSRNGDVVAQISATPAHTFQGVIFKARISRHQDNYNPELVESLVADLLAIGGTNA